MNKSIIFWRHIVGVAIVLAIHSCVVSIRSVESVSYFVGWWTGSILIAFGIAGAISGFGYLFFTSYLKGKGVRTFVIFAWVTAGFLLFGQWVLPGVVEQIKMKSHATKHENQEVDYRAEFAKRLDALNGGRFQVPSATGE